MTQQPAADHPGYELLAEPEDLGDIENSKENRCAQFAVSIPPFAYQSCAG